MISESLSSFAGVNPKFSADGSLTTGFATISDKLKASAKNNTVKDFEFSYFDDIDDALIEGLEQNQDFFSLLLNDEEIKREVLGIFTEEIYNSLKKAAEE